MGVQLYPPIIPNVLTAMYNDTEGIAIAIPFSLNRAVSASQIYNFNIKIKTVFDNKTIYIGDILTGVDYTQGQSAAIAKMIAAGVISGHIKSAPALVVGQYYKIQVAFVNYSDATGGSSPSPTVGIYSSVATIKYTALPEVAIQGDLSITENNIFAYTYQGSFDNSNDPSETRDQYRFDLLLNNEVAFTSGWLFKDQYKENDEYTFTDIQENEVYQLRYGVKTINGVEAYSELYPVVKYEVVPSELAAASLRAANNFDNGYIELSFEEGTVTTEMDAINGMFRVLRKSSLEDLWTEVGRIHFDGATQTPSSWTFQDFLIEQGMSYTYALQQYNDHNVYSVKMLSPVVEADFEDSFLYDGIRQLKLKFNPKISSYKIDRQEQKLETIGSQYPFFVRNSKIAYHEFPLSGLCSYWMDEEELFMTDKELGLTKEDDTRSKTEEGPTADFSERRGRTLALQGYNFAAERKFKNTVLEWLGNGKPKFFKSPAEGNFIIRVMNPSLSPEDKLSRMIHNFSATAYEAMEINQDNLLASGFIKEDNEDFIKGEEDTFNKIIKLEPNITEYYVTPGNTNFQLSDYAKGVINSVIAKLKTVVVPFSISDWGVDIASTKISNLFDEDGQANIVFQIGPQSGAEYPINEFYIYNFADATNKDSSFNSFTRKYAYYRPNKNYVKNYPDSLVGIPSLSQTMQLGKQNAFIDDRSIDDDYSYDLDLILNNPIYTFGSQVYLEVNYVYKYIYES